ncbi:hypothetical protein TNCT_654621 [Trichonephila clavata]|uniref:Uncharacterized protein n=1 Tax=Trichonephila clavata TaxID=2740835 RepID=A0A8X6H890_TRICU|nr:hypothetical protein TNCT_654621 [Trichonephila clavata]
MSMMDLLVGTQKQELQWEFLQAKLKSLGKEHSPLALKIVPDPSHGKRTRHPGTGTQAFRLESDVAWESTRAAHAPPYFATKMLRLLATNITSSYLRAESFKDSLSFHTLQGNQ